MLGEVKSRSFGLVALAAGLLLGGGAQAITITYDYTYDTNDFFALNPQAVDALDAAAEVFTRFTDELDAIEPDPPADRWRALFYDPGTGLTRRLSNLIVPQDTLIVYVGGQYLPGSVVGEAGPGGFTARGSTEWLDTVSYRGQEGASLPEPTDFGPWGGSISFDIDTSWNFSVASGPAPDEVDFLSVAIHELAHVLGFGIADSWETYVDGGLFTGPVATTVYAQPVPLSEEGAHWADGTLGRVGGSVQETCMDPVIYLGARKLFTDVDYAGMIDVGWEYPPPGDANADGLVDGADYTRWADNYLSTPVPPSSQGGWIFGNFNEDTIVDGADYTIWADNYKRVAAPAAGGSETSAAELAGLGCLAGGVPVPENPGSGVPEPTALAVLAAGALALIRRRRS